MINKMIYHHYDTNKANLASDLYYNSENKEKTKINGWLYLPTLGLTLMPFNIYFYLNLIIINHQETASVSNYLMTLIVVIFAMYIITVMATWLFLRKSRAARNMMIIYYFSGLVLALCLTIVPNVLYNITLQYRDAGVLAGAIVGTIIWVPYFIFFQKS